MHRARNILAPPVEFAAGVAVKMGFSPTSLTLVGALISVAAAALIAAGLFAAGGVVVLLAGAFDMLDGAAARLTNRATTFGAFIDSVIDRVSEAIALFGLLWFFLQEGNQLGAALVYLAVVGSTLVSYARARAEGLGVECKGGLMQRPERVVTLGVGIIIAQWWMPAILIVLAVIAALTALTTVQRIMETSKATR